MPIVSQLDVPEIDYDDPSLVGERFHESLRELAGRHWLARVDIGFLVLEREAAMAFLRDRRLSFPAVQLLLLQGIDQGPIHERTVHGLMTRSGEPHLRLR